MAALDDGKVDAKVRAGLTGTAFEASSIERLTGGLVNWGYRATLSTPLDDGTSEVFLKHGETWVAKIPDFAVNLVRCRMEAQALRHLTEHPFTGQTDADVKDAHQFIVRTPKLLHFDEATTTQIHEHMPNSTTLKAYALQHYAAPTSPSHEPECRQIGKAVSRWLNEFAKRTTPSSTSTQPGASAMRQTAAQNKDLQQIRHHFSYGWLPDRLNEYPGILGEAREVLEGVLEVANAEMQDEGALCVVHGDLAPANIVLPATPLSESREATTIFVVDWESVHLNLPHFDIGQLAADTYLLWLAKGSKAGLWILDGLLGELDALSSVNSSRREAEDMAFRVALHMGCFLICMMPLTPDWGPPETIEALVRVGRDIVVHAVRRERGWFEGGELGGLFARVPK